MRDPVFGGHDEVFPEAAESARSGGAEPARHRQLAGCV